MQVSNIILTMERSMRDVLDALARRLTFGDNMQCSIREVADTGPADTEFTVQHNLGKTPTWYIANTDGGVVYDSNRSLWDDKEVKLKCSASNASVKLVLF